MARPRKTKPPVSDNKSPDKALKALKSLSSKLGAVSTGTLTFDPADIPSALTTVFAAIPAITPYRMAIVEDLPKHPITDIDSLEDFALVTWYAGLVSAATGGRGDGAESEEGKKLRDVLLIGAEALAHKSLLDPAQVSEIKKLSSPDELASSLQQLADMFDAKWQSVASRTAVERGEVDRARELSHELAIGASAEAFSTIGEPSDVRLRAFTLLVQAYDSTRRAISYLRWSEGDVDSIAPVLIKRKRAPRQKQGDESASRDTDSDSEGFESSDSNVDAVEGANGAIEASEIN